MGDIITKMNLTKEQEREFEDKIKKFEEIRKVRFSLFEGIFIAFLTSIIILTTDLVAGEDKIFKFLLILLLVIVSWQLYKLMLKQTQKPVIALGNAIGTIEHGPVNVTGEDGQVYSIFKVSDFIHEEGGAKNGGRKI